MNTNLVGSSSRLGQQKEGKNKHIVIYYATDGRCIHAPHLKFTVPPAVKLICISVDDLISNSKWLAFEHQLYAPRLNVSMNSVCTTGDEPCLYLFGGIDSVSPEGHEIVNTKVYSYDLHKLIGMGDIGKHNDMTSKTYKALSVQVGDDSIYVLSLVKFVSRNLVREATLQKYNFKEDIWTFFDSNISRTEVLNECIIPISLCNNPTRIPHVVIGHKFHVSLGQSSFTFDTCNGIWENCKLFESVLSSSYEANVPMKSEVCGGPPFIFDGRAILWDKNIVLGVCHDSKSPLVAFLLDNQDRVVNTQSFTLDNKCDDGSRVPSCDQYPSSLEACLVDLGRDGYFGIVRCLSEEKENYSWHWAERVFIELLTFKVSKLPQSETGSFLKCQFVSRDVLTPSSLSDEIRFSINAFCV